MTVPEDFRIGESLNRYESSFFQRGSSVHFVRRRENNYADEKRREKSREMKKSPKSQRGGYQQQGRRGHRQQNRKEEDINNREDDDMNIVEEKDKRNENRRSRGKGRKKTVLLVLAVAVLLLMSILFLRSCRARDEPLPDTQRIYEESRRPVRDCPVPTEENKRLNLALSDSYHISEEHPLFYIGFPENNIFDVVFMIKDSKGNVLYETDYVKPGTNVAIDGTAFLEKGDWQLDCLVSVFNHETGVLISDCTTIVLNICYE